MQCNISYPGPLLIKVHSKEGWSIVPAEKHECKAQQTVYELLSLTPSALGYAKKQMPKVRDLVLCQ